MLKRLLLIVILITGNLFFGSIFSLKKNNYFFISATGTEYDVRTILFYNTKEEQSFPAILLEDNEKVMLRFDVMGAEVPELYYQITQYDATWTKQNNFEAEFLKGFNNQLIEDYSPSGNTTVDYTNYKVSIPNDNIEILQTGNYILSVYTDSELKDILLKRRFVVYSNDVRIRAGGDPYLNIETNKMQCVQATIDFSELFVSDPQIDLKTFYLVNQNWKTLTEASKFRLSANNELVFSDNNAFTYYGGSEYRYFDNRNLYVTSERVMYIEVEAPYYHFHLKEDRPRDFREYFFLKDMNGQFVLEKDVRWNDKHTEADYNYVHFNLKVDQPYLSRLYVYGALTNWDFEEENELRYLPDAQIYTCKLLLKQGHYDYRYVMKDFDSEEIDWSLLENSYAITENEVYILVYYKDYDSDFERLAGVEVVEVR